ncbi:hypothetical protein P7H16_26715 [Paenibacillus larvae]|nr:hypothetical protein [Paenibacillus larvae]MDT2249809.1 hypothetical protein [Paenibacillus larvae]
MAHYSEQRGKASQLAAKLALVSSGWVVAEPETEEPYDLIGRDPVNGEWYTFQVKTIRKRYDRGGDLVVYAKKNNGEPYSKSDADYIVGVLGEEDESPRVFYFENRGIGEYWASEARAAARWQELPLSFDRELVACPS